MREESVLVYRVGQLGDTLVSLPAMRAIKRRHPGARLVLLTDAHPGRGFVSSWEVLERTGIFSDVLFYEPRRSPWRALRLAARIRRMGPRSLYYLAPSPRAAWQIVRDRIFFRGLCGIKDARGLAVSEPQPGLPEHARLSSLAGGPEDGSDCGVPIGDRERDRIDLLWRQEGLPAGARPIALGPGSKLPAKRWPVERYAALACRLSEAFPGLPLAIVGGAEDAGLAGSIARRSGARQWAGRLSVLESAEALRRCALYVGNDTGAMHLAASVGTRCVAIFSARDLPGRWEPIGAGHVVLRKRCLTAVGEDEVFEACRRVLGG